MKPYVPENSFWQNKPASSLTRMQKYWLHRPGALTIGLRALGHVELRVLREYAGGLGGDEHGLIPGKRGQAIWIREVCMSINGTDSVFARSITPSRASQGTWQGIRRLRTRPLADMLYNDPDIARSSFATARLGRQHALFTTFQRLQSGTKRQPYIPSPGLLARCSVFWRHAQPLVVEECFLPGFWALAQRV